MALYAFLPLTLSRTAWQKHCLEHPFLSSLSAQLSSDFHKQEKSHKQQPELWVMQIQPHTLLISGNIPSVGSNTSVSYPRQQEKKISCLYRGISQVIPLPIPFSICFWCIYFSFIASMFFLKVNQCHLWTLRKGREKKYVEKIGKILKRKKTPSVRIWLMLRYQVLNSKGFDLFMEKATAKANALESQEARK